MKIHFIALTVGTLATTFVHADIKGNIFGDKAGCLIVRELKSQKIVYQTKSKLCSEQLYACSTFKVPLALMAFDSGILKDEHSAFRWDGKPQLLKGWEKDHTARSWLKDSVVWFSQRITPMLGLEKMKSYLADFKYGNQDMSGGIDKAWLGSSLKVSPEDQVDLLIRLKKRKLKLKSDAIDKTLSMLPIEVDEPTLKISGKTGSGFSFNDPKTETVPPFRVGWYVGYMTRDSKEYVFAVAFKDKATKGVFNFGGMEARKIAIENLPKLSK